MSEDYWVTPEGLAYRIEDIAHDITWTTLNTVTQTYAEPFQVTLQWVSTEDDKVCDLCLDQEGLYDPQAILPDIPAHVNCRCSWGYAPQEEGLTQSSQ